MISKYKTYFCFFFQNEINFDYFAIFTSYIAQNSFTIEYHGIHNHPHNFRYYNTIIGQWNQFLKRSIKCGKSVF